MTDRAAILALDCCAFEWPIPNTRGLAPVLAYRVGHFAVFRSPDGMHVQGPDGEHFQALAWMVAHVASGLQMLDFASSERAWQFADEISRACGERLDNEPRDARAFCAAVPDVVAWVRMLSGMKPGALLAHDRSFMRFDDFEAALAANGPARAFPVEQRRPFAEQRA
jgi:hypothetical protein